MQELVHRTELVGVLAELAKAGIAPLILKGTALAHSHYPSPALRPRGDTDLLIPDVGPRLGRPRVLDRLGYARASGVTGGRSSRYQARLEPRHDPPAITHNLDVHWRINNSQILAKLLTFDELAARPRRSPRSARTRARLCPVHALLLACCIARDTQRAVLSDDRAYLGGDRLIWLYDFHLLVDPMSDDDLADFVAPRAAKQ